jgi:hypothetical protein
MITTESNIVSGRQLRAARMKPHQPALSLAAERMRRHRQRRRDGMRCLTIELRETEIDGLVLRGMLPPVMRHDKNAVVEALYAFFDQTLGATA